MQAHVFISGMVQGVGFRHFVRREAQKLGLTGWVRNLPDRRVEALLAGSKNNIEKAIVVCRKGPFLAEVEDVQVLWKDKSTEFSEFKIV